MSEEEGEDVFSKIEEIQKKHNKLLEENNRQMKMFGQRMGVSIGFGGSRQSYAMGSNDQSVIKILQEQKDLMRKQVQKLEELKKQYNTRGADPYKYGADPDHTSGTGSINLIFRHLGQRIAKAFEPLTRIFRPMIKTMMNIGGKVWGGLKKSGLLPGVFAGIGIAVGMVIAKVIQASPLLTAMMKMMNMGITLMLRPIGDFIGSVLRPMMTYFIKDVAVPFFQATKGLVNDGGKIGKGLLAFFIQPIESIGAAIIKALNIVLPADMLGGKNTVLGANMMFADPARMFRKDKNIGEFSTGAGGVLPSPQE